MLFSSLQSRSGSNASHVLLLHEFKQLLRKVLSHPALFLMLLLAIPLLTNISLSAHQWGGKKVSCYTSSTKAHKFSVNSNANAFVHSLQQHRAQQFQRLPRSVSSVADDARWDNRFDSLGMDSPVFAVTVHGNDVYAGGIFTTAGEVTVNGIARWDGTKWSPLGSGVNGAVYAILVTDSSVYAGGQFDSAGGIAANNIARWDGSAWSSLDQGTSDQVWGLAGNDTTLYAAGFFEYAGSSIVDGVAKWNGSAWSDLGGGLSDPALSVAVQDTNVFVTGLFEYAGCGTVDGIARWDGYNWYPLGNGFDNPGLRVVTSDTNVYATGLFHYADTVLVNGIAKWDGYEWSALGSGVDSLAWGLAIDGKNVYVGGAFTSAGGIPASNIAEWDGSGWSALGSGTNGIVMGLEVGTSGLYAGGDFYIAGDKYSFGFGHWFTNPFDTRSLRTASMEQWATAVDGKGKRAAVKRKADKDFFEFTLVADSTRILSLNFGVPVNGAITLDSNSTDTVIALHNVKKINDTLSTLHKGDTINISGVSGKGAKIKVTYQWGKEKAVTLKADSLYEENQTGLPLPTLVNVGEELFPKGYGNHSPYFANGLTLGVPQGAKKANSMVLGKYADVLTTLGKQVKHGFILDTAVIRCLDSLGKKAITKQLKALSPDKYQNKLLGEALALKLNIAASATQKFPVGLGDLIYKDPSDTANLFNSSSVSEISMYADSMLSCLTLSSKPGATLSELYSAVRKINVAFTDSPYPIDTLSFAAKTMLSGIRPIYDVSYLHTPALIEPKSTFEENAAVAVNTPQEFTLNQNYPNPFNPTTTLSFVIGHSSPVTLKVYDILGREVATLIDHEQMESGSHEVQFNGANLSSGVYFYRLQAGTYSDVKKLMLMK